MKISSVKSSAKIPMTLVEVRSDDGLVGIGGWESPVSATRPILEKYPWRLANIPINRRLEDVEWIWQDLVEATQWEGVLSSMPPQPSTWPFGIFTQNHVVSRSTN